MTVMGLSDVGVIRLPSILRPQFSEQAIEMLVEQAGGDVDKAIATVQQIPVNGKGKIPALLPRYQGDADPWKDLDIEDWGQATKVTGVQVANLLGHHKRLDPDRLVWHLQNAGDPTQYTGPGGTCPFVFTDSDGVMVVCDGDNRVTALRLLGVDQTDAWMLTDDQVGGI